jgi:hypothetical protein
MNWTQLHTSSTPEEREETTLLLLRTIEERRQRLVLSRGRLVREKRGNFPGAHFINDRRRLRRTLPRILTRLSYIFILLTVSVATWLFVLYAPAQLAIPTMLLHLVGLTAVLLFKPYRSITHFARSA